MKSVNITKIQDLILTHTILGGQLLVCRSRTYKEISDGTSVIFHIVLTKIHTATRKKKKSAKIRYEILL